MPRQILPNRRPQITHTLAVDGEKYHISVGYDLGAKPKEVFIRGSKVGSHMDQLLDDAAVLISLGLQHGLEVSEMRKSCGDTLINRVLGLLNA